MGQIGHQQTKLINNLSKRLSGSLGCEKRLLGKVEDFCPALPDSVYLSRQTRRLSCLRGGWRVNSSSVLTELFRGADVCLLSSHRGGCAYVAALQREGSWVLPVPWGQAMIHSQLSAVSRLLRHRSGARWILIYSASRTINYKAGDSCYSHHIWHSNINE